MYKLGDIVYNTVTGHFITVDEYIINMERLYHNNGYSNAQMIDPKKYFIPSRYGTLLYRNNSCKPL